MIQGQSTTTADKERKFRAMYAQQGRIYAVSPRVLMGRPAYHIDLNAGSGHNDEYDVPGSPIEYTRIMDELKLPYHAYFIDRNQEACRQLTERFMRIYGIVPPHIEVCCEDNAKALWRIAARIPRGAVGTVLADPNGWLTRNRSTGEGVPSIDDLSGFFKEYRRMDFMMHLNNGFYKKAAALPEIFPQVYSISEFHWLFRKEHWLVSEPVSNGHTPFVCLIGRNFQTGDYAKESWHRLTSDKGWDICEQLELGRRRPNPNRSLFDEIA